MAIGDAGIGGRHNVGMLQLTARDHLAFESLQHILRPEVFRGNQFQRKRLLQMNVFGFEDRPHSAPAEWSDEPVVADRRRMLRIGKHDRAFHAAANEGVHPLHELLQTRVCGGDRVVDILDE